MTESDLIDLKIPDTEWDSFVASMEASACDGLEDTESRIDWYLESLCGLIAEAGHNRVVANERIERIRDWEAGESARLDRRREYLIGQIGMLAPPDAESMMEKHGKKSRTLPNGSFGYRQQPDTIQIDDAQHALNYARVEGLDIMVKESVSKTTLKAHAKSTGLLDGPGWHSETGLSEFYVKAAK